MVYMAAPEVLPADKPHAPSGTLKSRLGMSLMNEAITCLVSSSSKLVVQYSKIPPFLTCLAAAVSRWICSSL